MNDHATNNHESGDKEYFPISGVNRLLMFKLNDDGTLGDKVYDSQEQEMASFGKYVDKVLNEVGISLI